MKRVFDAISPYDRVQPARHSTTLPAADSTVAPTRGVPMDGSVRLRVDARNGKTRLADLYQQAPLRAFFPNEAGTPGLEAVLANVAGGLVGGDQLSVRIEAADGATALVTTQAAEKVYRSAGPAVRIDCELAVSGGAELAWMPQATILFDGANLERRTRLSVEPGASLLGGEVVAYGRAGSGERLAAGRLRDVWEVRREGRLVWVDRVAVEDWRVVRDNPACLAGARASALLVHASDDAAARLQTARAILDDTADAVASGVTTIGGLLVARWLGRDAKALLDAYTAFWRRYRAIADAPGRIPRIWAV